MKEERKGNRATEGKEINMQRMGFVIKRRERKILI